jgi:hypothetical protein
MANWWEEDIAAATSDASGKPAPMTAKNWWDDDVVQPVKPAAPAQGQERPGVGQLFLRGIDQMQSGVGGFTEAVGETAGNDTLTQWGKGVREVNQQQMAEGPQNQDFWSIDSLGDVGAFAKESLVQNAPQMALSIPSGIAGAAAGAALGPVGAAIGGFLGAFVPSFVLNVGEGVSSLKAKDPNAKADGYTWLAGTAAATLDSVLPGKLAGKLSTTLAGKFGKEVADQATEVAAKTFLTGSIGRFGKEVGKDALTEFATESLQSAITEAGASATAEQAMDPNWWKNAIAEGAAGAFAGGGTSAVVSGVSGITSPKAPIAEADTTPPVQDAIIPDDQYDSPRLTPEDRASPIPNQMIDEGKARLDAPFSPEAAPAPQAAPAQEPIPATERAMLRNLGEVDEEIDQMAPPERAQALDRARRDGITITEVDVGRARAYTMPAPAKTSATAPQAAGQSAIRPATAPEPTRAAEASSTATEPEWVRFPPNSGTLSIPRSEMPQIKSGDRSAMAQFLRARGVNYRGGNVDARALKPSQAEFSPGKVEKAKTFDGVDRAILISSDNYIIDGHHQWLAKLDQGETVSVMRLDKPFAEVLPLVRQFPSARAAEGEGVNPDTASPQNVGTVSPLSARPEQIDTRGTNEQEKTASVRTPNEETPAPAPAKTKFQQKREQVLARKAAEAAAQKTKTEIQNEAKAAPAKTSPSKTPAASTPLRPASEARADEAVDAGRSLFDETTFRGREADEGPSWDQDRGSGEKPSFQIKVPKKDQPEGKPVPSPVMASSSLESSFELVKEQNFPTNRDLKATLQGRVLGALKDAGLKFDVLTKAVERHLVKAAVADTRYALESNSNAIGWYNEKTRKSLRTVSLIHPEIATDPAAKFAFTWALAVTSNGMKVNKNFVLAEKAYASYVKTGKMPEKIGEGTASAAINKGMKLFNDLVSKNGIMAVEAFMKSTHPVKDIEAYTGLKVSGENASTQLFGAAALGPKIGNGFFANLYGFFDQLTIDRWFMRTWGRWTGELIVEKPQNVAQKRDHLQKLLSALTPADRKTFGDIIGKPLPKVAMTLRGMDEVAKAITKASVSKEVRGRMGAVAPASDPAVFDEILGKATKGTDRVSFGDEIRKAGNALSKYLDGQKEQPEGPPERNLIRRIMGQALDQLQEDYPALTMADLQAVLWYPEKRLYETAKAKEAEESSDGYDDDEAPDYANAAAALARAKGIPQSAIDRAQKEIDDEILAEQRSGRAGRGAGNGSTSGEAGARRQAQAEEAPAFKLGGRQATERTLFERGVGPSDARVRQGSRGQAGPARSDSENLPDGIPNEQVTAADFERLDDPAALREILKRPGWGVVTATRGPDEFITSKEDGPLKTSLLARHEKQNQEQHKRLRNILKRRRIPFVELQGMYEGVPDGVSYMINADEATVVALGREFSQDSILTRDGLVFARQAAPDVDATGDLMVGEEALSQDFYSVTPGGTPFSMGLDFGKSGPGVAVAPRGYSFIESRPQLPIRPDGLVELHHWSSQELSNVDPDYAGTGPLRGEERRTGGPKKVFFGINPRQNLRDPGTGYIKEGGLGSIEHVALVDPSRLYPIHEDPDGIVDGKPRAEAEQAIKDAGYLGYYATDDGSGNAPLGNVAALFEAVPVQKLDDASYKRTARITETDGAVTTELELTEDFLQEAKAVGTAMRKELDRLGLSDISLRVSERISALIGGDRWDVDGRYFKKMIDVALTSRDRWNTMNHEVIHAMKKLGVFSDKEWAILERRATKEWMAKYDIENRYDGFGAAMQREEGIAQAFADWMTGTKVDGILAKSFRKIRDVIEALGNGLRGNGFRSVNGIFKDIQSGKIGNRERGFNNAAPRTAFQTGQGVPSLIAQDNPGGEWLARKQERAENDMATQPQDSYRSKGLGGSVTGYLRDGAVMLPVSMVSDLPGAQGERRVAGDGKFDRLAASVEQDGWKADQSGNAIVVGVNHRGEAFLLEGNTRVAVAASRGIQSIRAEVRYFNGGERAAGDFSPDKVSAAVFRAAGQPAFSGSKQTMTEAFKRWFKDSKVVDENGEPLVVYHATDAEFDVFDFAKLGRETRANATDDAAVAMAESGVWFSDRDLSQELVRDRAIPSYLALKNPMDISFSDLWNMAESYESGAELRAAIEADGYDGLVVADEEFGGTSYIAFSPSQIKSATRNNGNFDPNDERIAFSLRQKASDKAGEYINQALISAKSRNSVDRATAEDGEGLSAYVHRKIVDRLDPLARLVQSLGPKIADAMDPYLQARLYDDTTRVKIQKMYDKFLQPALDELVKFGVELKELHEYLYALHAEERNRVVGLRNPPGSQFYRAVSDPRLVGASGMSTNDARAILSRVNRAGTPQSGAIIRAAKNIRQMLDENLAAQLAAGLIDTKTYDLLTNQWKNYVPMKNDDGMDPSGNWMPTAGKGFDIRGNEFEAATGSFSEADNVILHAAKQAVRAQERMGKNEVGKAVLRMLNKYDPDGSKIAQVYWADDPDNFNNIVKAQVIKRRKLNSEGKVVWTAQPNPFMTASDVIATKVGGRVYYIKFNDAKVGNALKNLHQEPLGFTMSILSRISNWQSIVNTRMNPAFTPINIIRDLWTGYASLGAFGFTNAERRAVVGNVGSAMMAMGRNVFGKTGTTAEQRKWDAIVADFISDGGRISFDNYAEITKDVEALENSIARAARISKGGMTMRQRGMEAFTSFVNVIEKLNDAGENGLRIAVYEASLKKGMTRQRAAFLARDITVDFKKKGELGSEMNAAYVFFNSSLQGNYNLAKRMGASKAVQAAATKFLIAGIGMGVINSMMAGDDEDGENNYHKMLKNKPWVLERNLVLFIGDGKYLSVPLPFGFNAFTNIGTQLHAAGTGVVSPLDAISSIARVAFDSFNPMGSGSLLSMIAPTVADPMIDIATNTNFAGNPIRPTENEFDPAPPPNSEQAFKSTNPIFVWMAQAMNAATGGDDVQPGWGDVYPDNLEHLWGFVSGGVGRFIAQLGGTATRSVDGEFEPSNTPYVRSFYGTIDADTMRGQYFSIRADVQEAKAQLKDYQAKGDRAEIEAYKRSRAVDLKVVGAIDAAEKQRRRLNKQRKFLEKQNPPDLAERLKKLDELEKEAMLRARKAYIQALQGQ